MNVLRILTPKFELPWLREHASVHHALERLEHSGRRMLAVLDALGRYVGSFSQPDVLNALSLEPGLGLADLYRRPLSLLRRTMSLAVLRGSADTRDLAEVLGDHAGLAIVDDRDVFVGIVERTALCKVN